MIHPPHREPLPLHVEERGHGPAMLFLHGFAAHSGLWRRWLPELERSHRVVLVDLKGHGRSPAPRDRRYGPVDQARLVARLVVERDLRDLTLVGHSLGGGVALATYLMLRDRGESRRVRRLISINGAAYPQRLPPYVRKARRPMARVLAALVPKRWLVRRVLRTVVHDPSVVTGELVALYADPLRRAGVRRAVLEMASAIVPGDVEAWVGRYGEVDVPTLLLCGHHDPVVPLWVAKRLAADLPQNRLVVLEACGHIPPEEQPGASLAAVRAFLDGA